MVDPHTADSSAHSSAATSTGPNPGGSTFTLPGAPPQAQLEQLLTAYIPKQRWFGGKSRRVTQTRITSSTEIPGTAAVLTTVAVHYEDGGPSDLYLLPLAVASSDEAKSLQSEAPKSIVLHSNDGETSTVLYDATASGEVRSALLQLIDGSSAGRPTNTSAASARANFEAVRSPKFKAESLLQARSRIGSAEQSNTSIIYGDQAILKLFRRLRHGENPDVEIARFLTETASFANIPAYLGDLHLAADHSTLAFLQQFAPNQGDGWDWTMGELHRFYHAVAKVPAPENADSSPGFAATSSVPASLRQHAGSYLDAAALLGRRTGEMHLALATPTSNSAFKAEPYKPADLDADRMRIGSQADAALNTLAEKLSGSGLDASAKALAQNLLDQRAAIRERATTLSGDPTLFGQRIRIHGDYHLGQLLRSGEDFLIVDFEGEPAKTLEERRRKQTPLKDVAGMLRSFSYAARSASDKYLAELQGEDNNAASLQRWATLWENSVCAEYLRGYREATANAGGLLPQPEQADVLLSALLLEKALYELLYELNNRPTWLHIPLAGLLALAGPTNK